MKRIAVILLVLLLCGSLVACAEVQHAQDVFVSSPEGAMIGKTYREVETAFGPLSMVFFEADRPVAYVFSKTNVTFHFDAAQAQAGWRSQLAGGVGYIPAAIALRDIQAADVCTGVSGRIRDFGIPDSDVTQLSMYLQFLRSSATETKTNTIYTVTTGDGAYDVYIYCARGEITVTADHQIRVMTAGLEPTAVTPQNPSYLTQLKNASVGDYVSFGSYPQTRTGSTKDPIEWLVLAKSGRKLLLISRYGLDNIPYNSKREDTAWSECSLRKWLNYTFLNNAFTEEEQQYIKDTKATADENPSSTFGGTWQGEDKTNKVFILSAREARKYFSSNAARACKATEYAKYAGSNKAYTDSGNGNCWWWLRTSGKDSDYATNVLWTGEVDYSGNLVSHAYGAVRPSIWVDPGE